MNQHIDQVIEKEKQEEKDGYQGAAQDNEDHVPDSAKAENIGQTEDHQEDGQNSQKSEAIGQEAPDKALPSKVDDAAIQGPEKKDPSLLRRNPQQFAKFYDMYQRKSHHSNSGSLQEERGVEAAGNVSAQGIPSKVPSARFDAKTSSLLELADIKRQDLADVSSCI